MWLICQAALGRGKNKLLVRGVEGAEWVFCPLIKSINNDRIGTDRCQGCKHFMRFEQTYIPQTLTKRKTLSFAASALRGAFRVRRPLGRLKATHPHTTAFPHIPSLVKKRQPLVDVFEEEDHLIVLAELPGVNESDININADENTLTISADTPTKKYQRIVRLPTRIKKDTIKFTCKNNVLQVRLQKL